MLLSYLFSRAHGLGGLMVGVYSIYVRVLGLRLAEYGADFLHAFSFLHIKLCEWE